MSIIHTKKSLLQTAKKLKPLKNSSIVHNKVDIIPNADSMYNQPVDDVQCAIAKFVYIFFLLNLPYLFLSSPQNPKIHTQICDTNFYTRKKKQNEFMC